MLFTRVFLFIGGLGLGLNLLSIIVQGSWYPVVATFGALFFAVGLFLKVRWALLSDDKKAAEWSRTVEQIVESGRQGMFADEDSEAHGEFLDQLGMGRRFLPSTYKKELMARLQSHAEARPEAASEILATIEGKLRPDS